MQWPSRIESQFPHHRITYCFTCGHIGQVHFSSARIGSKLISDGSIILIPSCHVGSDTNEPFMQDAIRKAKTLIEALGWIQRFRNRYVVVKLGGSALNDNEAVDSLLLDIVFMATVGMRPILVHGGGRAISTAMNEAGIEPRFVEGRRYTDNATLDIASRVLVNEICPWIVDKIRSRGAQSAGIHFETENALTGRPLTIASADGCAVDLGHVGHVHQVDRDLLVRICSTGTIPVIPSIALDKHGHRLNVNADTAAAAVAQAVDAEKLVFLSDIPGILTDVGDPVSRISHVTAAQLRHLIADGTIAGGMVPKAQASLDALTAGVRKVHIVDAGMPHSLLLEIYSDTGVGTEIVA